MTLPSPNDAALFDRLEAFVADSLHGEVTPSQLAEMNQLLRDNEAARTTYLELVEITVLLPRALASMETAAGGQVVGDQRLVAGGEESGVRRQESEVGGQGSLGAAANPPTPNPEIPKSLNPQIPAPPSAIRHPPFFLAGAWQGTREFFSQEVPFAILITLGIFAIAGLIGSQITITHPTQYASLPGYYASAAGSARADGERAPLPPPAPKTPEPKIPEVAQITGMLDCEFSDNNLAPMHHRIGIGHNNKFALKKGLMEITYFTGAKVILQGPCTYEIDSASGGYLSIGKLTARVETAKPQAANQKSEIINHKSSNPQSPISNPFAVKTPTALVTDLGTEFGVEVDEDGTVEAHVFDGRIDFAPQDGSAVIHLSADGENRAARLARDKATPGNDRLTVTFISASQRDRFASALPGRIAGVGAEQVVVASYFDQDGELWQCYDNGPGLAGFAPGEGNPGGCIKTLDMLRGPIGYFFAPLKFLGEKSALFGGELRYDILACDTDAPPEEWKPFRGPDVILVGAGRELSARAKRLPEVNCWTSFRIPLTMEAGWRLADKSPASEGDLRAVLADLQQLRIRSEYTYKLDAAKLDNVLMIAPGVRGAPNKTKPKTNNTLAKP